MRCGRLASLDEEKALVGLPKSLKLQLDLFMHSAIFTRLPLFRQCEPEEVLLLVQRLQSALSMPGEALVKQGVQGVGMACHGWRRGLASLASHRTWFHPTWNGF